MRLLSLAALRRDREHIQSQVVIVMWKMYLTLHHLKISLFKVRVFFPQNINLNFEFVFLGPELIVFAQTMFCQLRSFGHNQNCLAIQRMLDTFGLITIILLFTDLL